MTARSLKDPSTAGCRIFVGHLQTDEITKMELEQHFSKYGNVIGSLMHLGFGFVQFETEKAAQLAIQNENGQMFKNRRIDVKPAKKNTHGSGGSFTNDNSDKSKNQDGKQFSGKNNQFTQRNNSFGGGGGGGGNNEWNQNQNQSFNQNNQDFNQSHQDSNQNQDFGPSSSNENVNSNPDILFEDKGKTVNNPPPKEQFNSENNQNTDGGDFQQFSGNNDSFNSNNQMMDSNDSFHSGSQGKSSGNSQFGTNQGQNDTVTAGNNSQNIQNRGGNNQFSPGTQNRSQGVNNQNRNQGGNQNPNQGGNSGGTPQRLRGNRGGKNRNKNRDSSSGGNNFRDRSPLNRGPRGNDDKVGRDWDHNMMPRGNNFGRDSFPDNGRFDDRFKEPMGGPNFGRGGPNDYPLPVPEKNDCEIIVVNKSLTEYAEAIEAHLKKMGLTVDLLFPNEEVPLSRVLGNIANRGCLYAVVVTQTNMEHASMTLNILHGLPQEHRNMPVDDALGLINRDFSNYKSGGRSVPFNVPFASDRHPDAIQVLLNMLADNHQLTVLQYDRVLKYLEIKREDQVQVELGDAKDLAPTSITVNDPKQVELQSRILNILNSNKPTAAASVPSPVPAPVPVPISSSPWGTAVTATSTTSSSSTGVTPSPLLNDPTVQKALDSLLQGNLLKSIGDSQPAPASQPLFAAFPNITRF